MDAKNNGRLGNLSWYPLLSILPSFWCWRLQVGSCTCYTRNLALRYTHGPLFTFHFHTKSRLNLNVFLTSLSPLSCDDFSSEPLSLAHLIIVGASGIFKMAMMSWTNHSLSAYSDSCYDTALPVYYELWAPNQKSPLNSSCGSPSDDPQGVGSVPTEIPRPPRAGLCHSRSTVWTDGSFTVSLIPAQFHVFQHRHFRH